MIIALEQYLSRILPSIEGVVVSDWLLEATTDDRFGDYATNVAFRLSKLLKKSPLVVVELLAVALRAADVRHYFDRIDAAAPGFLNFFVTPNVVGAELVNIVSSPRLSSVVPAATKKKINIEFISANPTGPLTMANGRGGFFGDVLANVFAAVGHDVTREYYINDAGVQIKRLGESVLASLGIISKTEEQYQGEYVAALAKKYEVEIRKMLDDRRSMECTEEIGRLIAADLLAQIKQSTARAGIHFDLWFSEHHDLRQKGALEKTLELLRSLGKIEVRDGAQWLTAESGKSKVESEKRNDRVLVKSDGNPTYLLADIAHHYVKFFDQKFDQSILILGADHHGYVAPLRAGIEALGVVPDRFTPLIVQLVRLARGGVEVRMSKRKGEFITLNDLLDEVGVDTTRFFFLMYSLGTHMDFDLALAKERSVKNPVYYVQYAFVRSASILRNANSKFEIRNSKQIEISKFKFLNTESELRLMKLLVQFPDVMMRTAADYQVHRLTQYALSLARALHHFYESERVVSDDAALTEARCALVAATKLIFERLFRIVGISAPEKM